MSGKLYGSIKNGSYERKGYTLDEVVELCDSTLASEGSIDDNIGDLCIAPQVMKDLAMEVKRLQSELDAVRAAA